MDYRKAMSDLQPYAFFLGDGPSVNKVPFVAGNHIERLAAIELACNAQDEIDRLKALTERLISHAHDAIDNPGVAQIICCEALALSADESLAEHDAALLESIAAEVQDHADQIKVALVEFGEGSRVNTVEAGVSAQQLRDRAADIRKQADRKQGEG